MDIKELDKRQLILLTLLITFVVSIATGIVTVSLMNQAPKSVPQTINNVIQRTIEKVSTVESPAKSTTENVKNSDSGISLGSTDSLVPIYQIDQSSSEVTTVSTTIDGAVENKTKELGQGVIISDLGLILVDSSILNDNQSYRVILNKTDFDADILKKFNNGFSILKISEKKAVVENPLKTDTIKVTQ